MSNWRNVSDDSSKFLTFERDNLTLEETNKNWAVPFNWKVSSSDPNNLWSCGFYLGLDAPNTVEQAKYTVEVGLSLVDLGTWITDCVKHHKGSGKQDTMKAVIGVQASRNIEVPAINEQQWLIAQNSDYAFQKFDLKELA